MQAIKYYLFLVFIIQLSGFTQNVTIEHDYDGKKFKMIKKENILWKSDTLCIEMQIINNSTEPFYIFDSILLSNNIISHIDDDRNIFSYSIAELRYEFSFPILKMININDSVRYLLQIPRKKLNINQFKEYFYIDFEIGFFSFSEDLFEYTKPHKNLIKYHETIARDMNSFKNLLSKYKQIYIEGFLIKFQEN